MNRPPDQIVLRSRAKLNLGLEVLGRRDDGYHEIITILHEIDLHDRFIWSATGEPFEYVSPPEVDAERDLVRRALDLAPDRSGWTGTLRLEKRIPVSAGLGGGSSNAALALRLAFPGPVDAALLERAGHLGSDVPFFLHGGTALATGSGTTLQRLPSPKWWFVIVVPDVLLAAKTASMYGRLSPNDFTDGSATRATAEAMLNGTSLRHDFPNTFLAHVRDSRAFGIAHQWMHEVFGGCMLSGAGPTLYTVLPTRGAAAEAAARLPAALGRMFVESSAAERDDARVAALADALRGTIHA